MDEIAGEDGRDGGDADFTAFVAGTSARLLHAGDLLTGSRARGEDLVQHALAQAYSRWGSLRYGNPEAYVRKTMLHAYLDWWRRVRPRELPQEAAGHGPSMPDFASDLARRDSVQRALSRLTKRERAVVVLRYWCDLSEFQIAEELGVAPGTVKSTSARALAKLREDSGVQLFAAPVAQKAQKEGAQR